MSNETLILAPMVRIGCLPFRLLSLEYGADFVYSPEIIDHALITSTRVKNEEFNTVDYVSKDGRIIFQTTSSEKERLILQLGSSDPNRALEAALKVSDDVSGIDLNCGCPKMFSIQGGMGAALLSNPSLLLSILRTLVNGLSIPVSCKIRIFPEYSQTIDLIQEIVKTGISRLAIHARTINDRPRNPAHLDFWKFIKDLNFPIPIIANGDFFSYEDRLRVEDLTGIRQFMIARAAEANPSVFQLRKAGDLLDSLHEIVIPRFLKLCIKTGVNFFTVKYNLLQMLQSELKDEKGLKVVHSKTMEDLIELWK